jgi:hypothetical protein
LLDLLELTTPISRLLFTWPTSNLKLFTKPPDLSPGSASNCKACTSFAVHLLLFQSALISGFAEDNPYLPSTETDKPRRRTPST